MNERKLKYNIGDRFIDTVPICVDKLIREIVDIEYKYEYNATKKKNILKYILFIIHSIPKTYIFNNKEYKFVILKIKESELDEILKRKSWIKC